ncbi:MAG TPA: DUF6064 family protein [Ignavibacteriales bacterium]|nr:DUF6064 family protein [Ignavibacteriales bacterium]
MQLPFTKEAFLNVFAEYNTSVFPLQIVFVLLAFVLIYLAYRNYKYSNLLISLSLAFYWIWIGVIYHILFFSAINKAAYFFGVLFILQGLLFIYAGAIRKELNYSTERCMEAYFGWAFIAYALIIYPILGMLSGHSYPKAPTFGLPCPTTIFTFGMFLFVKNRFPYYLLIIPVLWSILGFSAAVQLSVTEDFGLSFAGVIGLLLIIYYNKKGVHAAVKG